MWEVIFLWILAFIWIIFGIIQDLKTREIANWLNFSLIVFALGFRFFYSLFETNFAFFYQGVIGLLIFFVVGNLLYYGKLFAGGDAKLMIALGAILPFSYNFYENLDFFILFLMIFLIVGAVYTLISSLGLLITNFKPFKKEFRKQFKFYKKLYVLALITAIVVAILGLLIDPLLYYISVLMLFFIVLHLYAKAVDESCMIIEIKTSKLTEGDWLYKNVKVGSKTIKAKWEGLRKEEIKLLKKKYKKIKIRQGIPFSPVFLISLLIVIYFLYKGLGNPFW